MCRRFVADLDLRLTSQIRKTPEPNGQLGNDQLIQADTFRGCLALERRVQRLREPDHEPTTLSRCRSLDEPVTLDGVADQFANLFVFIGLDECLPTRISQGWGSAGYQTASIGLKRKFERSAQVSASRAARSAASFKSSLV